jgi:hypothetical protein
VASYRLLGRRIRPRATNRNRRLLQTESITHDSMLAEETFQQLNRPHLVNEQRVSALRFADPMVQAMWNALLVFDLLPAGFSNRQLRSKLAVLRGQSEDQSAQGRMSYQLRTAPSRRSDRTHPQNSSLPPHELRLPCRLLHPYLRTNSAAWPWPGTADNIFISMRATAQLR